MSWELRLQEAAYTAPDNTRIEFDYEDVSFEFDKKGTAFEFGNSNQTYVQQTGNTLRRYPLRIFFWGENYDRDSSSFISLLEQSGIGKLEHPSYGTMDVVPLGTIRQRDDLKTSSNQAIIEVTFFNTIKVIYPLSQQDARSTIFGKISNFSNTKAFDFSENLDLQDKTQELSFIGSFNQNIDGVGAYLKDISKTVTSVENEFNTINQSINDGIDTLIGKPTTLAIQTIELIKAPSRAASLISQKIDGYTNIINGILGKENKTNNDLANNSLFAESSVVSIANSCLNSDFETKKESIQAAEDLLSQFDLVNEWREDNTALLNEFDTGESYQDLQDIVALTAGYLIQLSFNLKTERIFVNDRNRTIVDLAAELYGKVDEKLDEIININELNGDEILELPINKEIIYYV
jgi:hypothetical protein